MLVSFLADLWGNTYVAAIGVLAILGGGFCVALLLADRFFRRYGDCTVRINDEAPFTVPGGGMLLPVLYDRRIFVPSACGGQGNCGFCKVQVLKGGGAVLPAELPYLTQAEIQAGTRLACQVRLRRDIRLRVKEEFLHVEQFSAMVSEAHMVTPDTREIHLALTGSGQVSFRPGQYVQVFVPGTGETTFRAYSLASTPDRSREVELLVRLTPGGLGSTFLHNLRVGYGVSFTGPYGEFELDPSPDAALVCIGAGCGMAPMRSLLRHVAKVVPEKPCALYFGARSVDQAMYEADFRELAKVMPKLDLHYVLSKPKRSARWQGETGLVHESVARFLENRDNPQVFLCGPPQMVAAVLAVLTEKGISPQRIHYDEF